MSSIIAEYHHEEENAKLYRKDKKYTNERNRGARSFLTGKDMKE